MNIDDYVLFLSGISYNQPKFCRNATWNESAITFATIALVGVNPWALFVNTNNTIYGGNRESGIVRVWQEGSSVPIRNISGNLTLPYSLFVSDNNDIYVDNGQVNFRVDKWSSNSNIVVAAMYTCGACIGVYIDIKNNLYCSMTTSHQVVSKSLNDRLNVWNVVAGTGTSGSNSFMLSNPRGVTVHTSLDLYVADCSNHRIQRFPFQELNGTTVAGYGAPGTIVLNCPTTVIFDADGYMFISDTFNHRIIGSGPDGYRCIAACNGAGSLSAYLYLQAFISFDTYGNLYVMDYGNHRLQKFLLASNSCGKI
jgi:NHL repeat